MIIIYPDQYIPYDWLLEALGPGCNNLLCNVASSWQKP